MVEFVLALYALVFFSSLFRRCPGCKTWVRVSKMKKAWDNTGMTLEPDYICMECLVLDRLMGTNKFLRD